MIRSILVPVDGSTFGEHALPWALEIARRAKAPLQLVHVHQVIPPPTVAGVAVPTAAVRVEELPGADECLRLHGLAVGGA